MRNWTKKIVMLCIGLAMGASIAQFCKNNIAAGVGFLVASMYAIGWRIECSIAECEHEHKEDKP